MVAARDATFYYNKKNHLFTPKKIGQFNIFFVKIEHFD